MRTLDDIIDEADHPGAYGFEERLIREAYALGHVDGTKAERERQLKLHRQIGKQDAVATALGMPCRICGGSGHVMYRSDEKTDDWVRHKCSACNSSK